jgi:D-3-phosphoglycerate dehydrogenase
MTWRILVPDNLDRAGLERLRQEADIDTHSGLERVGEFDALVVRGKSKVTRQVIESGLPRLKVIGRAGVGVDNIDLQVARQHDLVVVNAPLAATQAVAELCMGLMLALARRIPYADSQMRQGVWAKSELQGVELAGKTLGIAGVGRIGSALARLAAVFEMRVIGYDPLLPPEAIRRQGAEPVDYQTLLSQSDYISLHVPLTETTRGMFNGQAFDALKPGARLICAARGGVVDEAALLQALDSGRLAGAALDVFSREPPGRTPLIQHPNLIGTPHIGAQTQEAQARAGIDIAHEVLAALEGKPLRWRVA